ncbi:MAG TPA: hypothetical protein ENK64_01130, partial [Flavobacteriales bacterium]|nr:hypothetical protein [Flavobacteriales bacterium]
MTHLKQYLILLSILTVFSVPAQKKKNKTSKEDPLAQTVNGLKFRGIGPAFSSGRIADFAV